MTSLSLGEMMNLESDRVYNEERVGIKVKFNIWSDRDKRPVRVSVFSPGKGHGDGFYCASGVVIWPLMTWQFPQL